MKCTKNEIDGVNFIACSSEKIDKNDLEEIKKYIEFRKERAKKLRKLQAKKEKV